MSEQLKNKCPVCGSYLFSDDDLVYCPECGAAHHRDCYMSKGSCGCDHTKLSKDTPPEKENTETEENDGMTACPHCKKSIPDGTRFCPYCGIIIFPQNGDFPQSFPAAFRFVNNQDPLGGVPKGEDFDGVPAEEIARFIGPNSIRILPIFKKFKTTKTKTNWNFIAFLSPQSHTVFRKMNLAAYVYTLLEILAFLLLSPLAFSLRGSDILQNSQTIYELCSGFLQNPAAYANVLTLILAGVGIAIFVGMRIFAGLYNDWLYKNHITSTIKKIRKDSDDDEEDFEKKGGARPIISLLVFMFFLYFGSYIPDFLGGLLLS